MIRTGTASSHIDMLAKLKAFLLGRGVSAGVVNAGGTGYTVGDILSVAGGTSTVTAQFEVTAAPAGVITEVLLIQSGIYTVDPTTTANAVTGGTGTGATIDLTMADVGWIEKRESFYAVSAVVAAGGTGYAVNNILTLVGGTSVAPAKFRVTAISGSAVTAVATLEDKGEYTVSPSNPVSTTVTPGSGTGCTLTVTYDTNKNLILEGEGSGSDQVFVGIRTFTSGSSNNWELAGMSGYNAASRFPDQPGISPGRYDLATPEHGHYVPLNNATFDYWIFANGRRFYCVFKIGSSYTNMYLGLINPFATDAEYPYPLAVFGCSSLHSQIFSGSVVSLSGLTDPIGHVSPTNFGPASIRDPGGSWLKIQNSIIAGGGRSLGENVVVFPCGTGTTTGVSAADLGTDNIVTTRGLIPGTGLPGVPTYTLNQSPNTPSYSSPLWPCMIIEASPVRQILGELDHVYWVSADGEATNLVTEDRITIGTARYLVFQNCNRTDIWSHLAIKFE